MLRSPVILGVVLFVALFAIALWVIDPASWQTALLGLVFLPVAAGLMQLVGRWRARAGKGGRSAASIRAAMVGAGALLASALGFKIAEAVGLIDPEGDSGRSWISVLLILIVVFGDLLAARLEARSKEN